MYKFDQDWSSNPREIANCAAIYDRRSFVTWRSETDWKITFLISAG